ncbi:hypothetical protein PTTG_25399 [Puccinia triticina 1-1 BBBD Race 1]|uniref:Tet-like 2OG-Fe(II) oxygenase domain-containing protein n=1 Tax=Puccinia triticina (isolate 1-1 / race 1 (BBBD)) TaxID=630390 RepID=A0A180H3E2_PUCT1|nr:hypothetical protein PTTG_25399 [Puccinia triticina 1-1 BBBD Race 1]WAR57732.1 hypothetical protein PtB15_8B785 [Puccinia triticina]
MGKNHRHHNTRSKLAKEEYKQRKKVEAHAALQKNLIGLNDTTNTTETSIRWQRVKYEELNLYPNIPLDNDENPTRKPTPAEVLAACKTVNKNFFLLNSGRCVIEDPDNPNEIICIIEFTSWDDLTNKDKEELNFLSTFLHDSQAFIRPVASSNRSWGGKMWVIGWQKSQDFMQIVGRYIKAFLPDDMEKYDTHFSKSS